MPEALRPEKSSDEDKENGGGITRRRFLQLIGGGAAFCLGIKGAEAQYELPMPSRYENGKWLYTLEEMRKIYEKEYLEKRPLQNMVRRSGEKYVGIYREQEVIISPNFLSQILSHLKDMLENGTAKFLFRLDAFHGHYFFIPEHVYKSRYTGLNYFEEFRAAMEDPALGVLFHNSEHLDTKDKNPETAKLYQKRNVIGWGDGRPMTILPLPKGESTAADIPEGYAALGITLTFAANKDGEFSISFGGEEIRLDLSFDDSAYY